MSITEEVNRIRGLISSGNYNEARRILETLSSVDREKVTLSLLLEFKVVL
jgi:hypothetical protein